MFILNISLVLILLLLGYFFWIRPILKTQPSLKEFYDSEGNILSAINLKLGGIKQKLLGAVSVIAIIVVKTYDEIIPLITGVDVTKLTSFVPDWAWPILTIAGILLMNWFRKLADDRHEEVVTKIAGDAAVTMEAASKVVQEATGRAQNSALEAIAAKKIDLAVQ